MRKVILIALFSLFAVPTLFSQVNTQDRVRWLNIERELRREAQQFVRDRQSNPELSGKFHRNTREDILVHLFYSETSKIYSISVILNSPALEYAVPFYDKMSIIIGASFKFETMFGRPEITLENNTVLYFWECFDWYRFAYHEMVIGGAENITLMFYADQL